MREATETSPLLQHEHGEQPSTNGTTNVIKDNANDSISKNGNAENGHTEQSDNALFQGSEELMSRMYVLFPAVAIGCFLSAADQTLIVSSSGKIGSDLNALNNISWIATAYFLTLTSFQPLYGKLSDIFGRKSCLLFAYAVFGTGCVLCGLSRNLGELVAARAFSGIGGGGMTTVVSILLSDVVPLKDRGVWQGYVNVVWSAGAALGAPLGGLMAETVGWRWLFLGQGPMCLLAFLAVLLVLPLNPKSSTTLWHQKLVQIDFLGALTLISAVFCLLLGLDRGSNVSWTSTYTLICCSLSIPFFTLFLFIETKFASHPFAPGHIIFSRSLFASYFVNFFTFAFQFANMFYVPLYLQAVGGFSAAQAGARMIPAIVCGVSASLLCGRIMQKTGRYFWLTVVVNLISLIGCVILFLSSGLLFDATWACILGLSLGSFGVGGAVTTTLIAVLANSNASDQAVATASTYLFRSLGSIVGISMASTVMQQVLRMLLNERLESGDEAEEIVRRVRQSLEFVRELSPEMRELVRACYQRATNAAFGVSLGLVCVACVTCWWIREKRIGR